MINLFLNTENKKDPLLMYLSGYSPAFSLLAYDDVSRKKCLFVSSFEVGMYKGIKCFGFNDKTLKQILLNFFNKKSLSKVGVNKSALSLNEFKNLRNILKIKFKDVSKDFAMKRLIKSSSEIKNIKRACSITVKIFKEICIYASRKQFKKENDLLKFIKQRSIDLDVELAFDPVVAAGSNAAKPHHIPNNKKLKGFVLLDFGVKYRGYCSDMSRMLYFGKPSKKELDAYDDLLYIQKESINALKLGVLFKEVDKAVRDKLGKYFIHSLGHGVGVEIHELPYISPKSNHKLQERMVFTIEPGVYYHKNYGIRIEDTIAFVNEKAKVLTNCSKELIII